MNKLAWTGRTMVSTLISLTLLCFGQIDLMAGAAEDAQMQFDRGEALEAQGSRAQAITEWQKVEAYGGDQATDRPLLTIRAAALDSLGEAQRQAEQLDDSQASFARILSRYPECKSACADATLGIAKIYQKKQDYIKALEWYGKVLSGYSDRTNRADLARGRIEEIRNKVTLDADAEESLKQAIATYDQMKQKDADLKAARDKAIADAASGKADEAKAALVTQFAEPMVRSSCGRLRLLGFAQLAIGDEAGARPPLEKMRELAVGEYAPEGYAELSLEIHFLLGDYGKVLSDAPQAIQIYGDGPSSLAFRFYLARTYDLLGQVDDCLKAYEALMSRYHSVQGQEGREMMALSLARYGDRLACLGRIADAKTALQRAVDEYPGTAYAGSAANSLRDLSIGGKQ